MIQGPRSYYEDARYCRQCKTYVPFLQSPGGAYCVRCDGLVSAFRRGKGRESSQAEPSRFQPRRESAVRRVIRPDGNGGAYELRIVRWQDRGNGTDGGGIAPSDLR